MSDSNSAAIVLAAGKGTRMKSNLPKVLHRIGNRAMVDHVLDRLAEVGIDRVAVVVGSGAERVADAVSPVRTAVQDPPLGTAHAVLAARDFLDGFDGDVLILFGDTPLLTADTIRHMLEILRSPADPAVAVLGFRPADTAEYGRLIVDGEGRLRAIVEHRDADEETRRIGFCNAGITAVDGRHLLSLLGAVGNDNAKGEFSLTDIVEIARSRGLECAVTEVADPDEVMGVNSRAELAVAEAVFQRRLRSRAMAGGATLIDPDTVYFSHDTVLGRDVTIGPQVVFGPGVTVGDGVTIRAFCDIEGARISAGAVVGPFARLRPGARIGEEVSIGNFVEIKASSVEAGARVNHLSYVGDSRVGARANIGAGTITCNYDGFSKAETDIGEGAFIGSNTALVAPVTIGAGAMVGAGSVIAKDVPADSLAVERSTQKVKAGWAEAFRVRRRGRAKAVRTAETGPDR
ncbi:MAG: bifunctional UDP-N-acetylglucosamine diphosphorylase/glucosamine-1-phosphate N-acetyltransferase GlmU [Defluviicoccus sp.]|nr:bifunctional UDP-N-acetylglucosamine diphosphorylase/glucosamine-1-phosphate N-acetyltransferase GlmU [Defluviicoccus sp.]MDE0278372.1 bifunctional UDP-N-acetylglucosamine diphosphorylase/glucosamine-1-phosphate N-acetyltransferase GlmU [Defluviicoccus sp.]